MIKVDEEISLRLIEPSDANRVFELTNESREYLREWLPWLDFTTKLQDTENFIQMCIRSDANKNSLNTVIVYKNAIVGIANFHTINVLHKNGSIGYWLGKQYQGKGIVTRVVKALTKYGFTELNLKRIEIRVAVDNKKSRSIPEKLGFVKEGHIRQAEWLYDHFEDVIIFGMLADEWIHS